MRILNSPLLPPKAVTDYDALRRQHPLGDTKHAMKSYRVVIRRTGEFCKMQHRVLVPCGQPYFQKHGDAEHSPLDGYAGDTVPGGYWRTPQEYQWIDAAIETIYLD